MTFMNEREFANPTAESSSEAGREDSHATGYWEVEVCWRDRGLDPRRLDYVNQARALLRDSDGAAGSVDDLTVADVYFLRGSALSLECCERIASHLLCDTVVQEVRIFSPVKPRAASLEPGGGVATVLARPGVMDPAEESLLKGFRDLGVDGVSARTAVRFFVAGQLDAAAQRLIADKVFANPVIQEVHWDGSAASCVRPFQGGKRYEFVRRSVKLGGLTDAELEALSRTAGLALSLVEMVAIRDHYGALGRDPSDVELETIAQTWSEHCCHKTLTGRIEHVVPGRPNISIDNLLKQTIVRATREIDAPWCLSVFKDNAGVIAFDDDYGVSFKVETHNHPSAIEPYGGAGTGIGGVLRDTLGTGLGAKPILNTDVFCFGPPDLARSEVPPGALHPLRVLRGVVAGVRDYGNRMGIPTASGAVYFDRRYVGNPLVFCGSVGLIPRDAIDKEARPGDRIYVLGGRTGRDGIHGATFSSIELTEESEMSSSGAVQIGNAITEKKVLDVLLKARDARLYRCVTDCGAGGLSSAVGEMGEAIGASVELAKVPLKYEGLSYWEIWISEAQERMVLAVAPEDAERLEALAASEDVECTDIGSFTGDSRLHLSYDGQPVCDLSMEFLHGGRPNEVRASRWQSRPASSATLAQWQRDRRIPPEEVGVVLHQLIASPNIASKEWIIRQYDHEVQGGSVLKPLQGVREDGPGDGIAVTPRLGSKRGIVVGCGMNPCYGDLDPYAMAASAVDEALRNVVAAGGDPERTALLDNFCWGNTERPETLGSLVEAARGCSDAAIAFGTPFISGKDSLNNEFRVGDDTIQIPPTLLISALSIVPDVSGLISMDLKSPGSRVLLIGTTYAELGGSHFCRAALEASRDSLSHAPGPAAAAPDQVHLAVPQVRLDLAKRVHAVAHALTTSGLALSCHDLSEGGLGVAAAEMAFAGEVGLRIDLANVSSEGCVDDAELLWSESNSRYLVEVRAEDLEQALALAAEAPVAVVGETSESRRFVVTGRGGRTIVDEALEALRASWKRGLRLDVDAEVNGAAQGDAPHPER